MKKIGAVCKIRVATRIKGWLKPINNNTQKKLTIRDSFISEIV